MEKNTGKSQGILSVQKSENHDFVQQYFLMLCCGVKLCVLQLLSF